MVTTATEARKNFFNLLKSVEAGQEVVIVKKDSNKWFKVSLVIEEQTDNKLSIAKQMSSINLTSKPPEEIKSIIEKKLSI
jgi:hypothetical protein